MRIYDFKGFPNPTRVRLALAEKGLHGDVEFVHIDVPAGEHRKPEFLAINPSSAVPVLELDDGTILSESAAITEYLDHLTGEPTLTGLNAKERGVIHMLQRKVEEGFLDAVANYFHFATPGLGPDIEAYENACYGERRRDTALRTMAWMDMKLADSDFFAGDRLTVVDLTAFAGFAFAGFAGIETPPEFANIAAWKERMNARPSMAVLS